LYKAADSNLAPCSVFRQTALYGGGNRLQDEIPLLQKGSLHIKTLIPMLALAISADVRTRLTADDETAKDHSTQYKHLEQQIDDFWDVHSTWGGTVNMDREQTLVRLMRGEVYSWQLQNNLKKRNDEEDYSIASAIGSRLHEQVLIAASNAIPV